MERVKHMEKSAKDAGKPVHDPEKFSKWMATANGRRFGKQDNSTMSELEKKAFWEGFEKQGSAFGHAAELGGLGILAAPSVQKLRGKAMGEKAEHKTELAGLGVLAAPSALAAGKGLLGKFRKAV